MISRFLKKTDIREVIEANPFNLNKFIKYYKKNKTYSIEEIFELCSIKNNILALEYLYDNGMNINIVNSKRQNGLHISANVGSMHLSNKLIRKNINHMQKDILGNLPIHYAITSNTIELFNILINKVEDIALTYNKRGNNLLFFAIFANSKLITKYILENLKYDINHQNIDGNSISHIGDICKNKNILKLCLEYNLDINLENNTGEDFIYLNCKKMDINLNSLSKEIFKYINLNKTYGPNNKTLLMHLLTGVENFNLSIYDDKKKFDAYIDRLNLFVKKGINVNVIDINKETILFQLIRAKSYKLIQYLIAHTHIDINHQNKNGETPLSIALFDKKPSDKIIKLLLINNSNCTLKNHNGFTIIERLIDLTLSSTVKRRKTKLLDNKLEEKTNYNKLLDLVLSFGKMDYSALLFQKEPIIFVVAISFCIPILQYLIHKGFELNYPNNNILYRVLEQGKKEPHKKDVFHHTLNFLINNNVNIDCKTKNNQDIIQYTICEHSFEVFEILTKKITSFSNTDKNGRTYLHVAAIHGKTDFIKFIGLKNRTLIDIADIYGATPLNYAVITSNKDAVFLLIKLGSKLHNHRNINEKMKVIFSNHLKNAKRNMINTSMHEHDRSTLTKLIDSMQDQYHTKSN